MLCHPEKSELQLHSTFTFNEFWDAEPSNEALDLQLLSFVPCEDLLPWQLGSGILRWWKSLDACACVSHHVWSKTCITMYLMEVSQDLTTTTTVSLVLSSNLFWKKSNMSNLSLAHHIQLRIATLWSCKHLYCMSVTVRKQCHDVPEPGKPGFSLSDFPDNLLNSRKAN